MGFWDNLMALLRALLGGLLETFFYNALAYKRTLPILFSSLAAGVLIWLIFKKKSKYLTWSLIGLAEGLIIPLHFLGLLGKAAIVLYVFSVISGILAGLLIAWASSRLSLGIATFSLAFVSILSLCVGVFYHLGVTAISPYPCPIILTFTIALIEFLAPTIFSQVVLLACTYIKGGRLINGRFTSYIRGLCGGVEIVSILAAIVVSIVVLYKAPALNVGWLSKDIFGRTKDIFGQKMEPNPYWYVLNYFSIVMSFIFTLVIMAGEGWVEEAYFPEITNMGIAVFALIPFFSSIYLSIRDSLLTIATEDPSFALGLITIQSFLFSLAGVLSNIKIRIDFATGDKYLTSQQRFIKSMSGG